MTILFLGLWIVCGFGSVVFAATSIRGRWSVGCAVFGFGLGALAARPASLVDPTQIGVLALLVALLGLAWPRHWILTSMAAGALAGTWAALFEAQGLPNVLALALSGGALTWSAWLACTRPRFAPPVLRDEALLAVFVLGCAVALAPGIQEGWRAALNLTVETRSTSQAVPVWALALSVGSLALGGVYAIRSRR